MVKIYTKKGDKGMTTLASGRPARKDSLRIRACGEIDELNAMLGVCRHSCQDDKHLGVILNGLQNELFVLGADLAMPAEAESRGGKTRRIKAFHTKKLEDKIDAIEAKLKPLRNFILPCGCEEAALTICRRAERALSTLAKKEKTNPEAMKYLNRLGDLLFMLARYANMKEGVKDERWSKI